MLQVQYGLKTQVLPIAQDGVHVRLLIPGGTPTTVTFSSMTPPMDPDIRVPRYEYADRGPAYALVVHPAAAVESK